MNNSKDKNFNPEIQQVKRVSKRMSSKQSLEELEKLTMQKDIKKDNAEKPSYSQFFQKYLPQATVSVTKESKEKINNVQTLLQAPVIIKRQRVSEIRDENYKTKREEELKKKEQELITQRQEQLKEKIL